MKTALLAVGLGTATTMAALSVPVREVSCECEELRRIRVLLEHQSGVVCNDQRCLPAPTPTVPNGGELP